MLLVTALSLLPHTVQNESYYLSIDESRLMTGIWTKFKGF